MRSLLGALALVLALPSATSYAQFVIQSKDGNGGTLEIYGFVQADFIQDFNRVDPSWNATLRPSKIPVVCPGDAGCGKDGETIFSMRQTRLGFLGKMPTEYGEISGKLEADLFGVGADAGQTTLRLRHAYGEMGQFLAGQTNSLFMDIDVFPNTIDYWGPAGMVFFRNIQGRWTPINKDGMKVAFALEAPGSAIDTGVIRVDPSLRGRNKYPDFTAQFRQDMSWGHYQVAGILRQIGFETPASPTGDPSGTKTGYGINLSGTYKIQGNNKILAQLVMGRGIANYMNDGGVDLAPNSVVNPQAEAVPLVGWLLYYDHWWNEKMSSSVGFSQTRQDNAGGQANTAFRTGSYFSVNFLWYPMKKVLLGGELLWGERKNNDGAKGDDTRIQFSAKYTF
jgi:hypothetical protein